MFSIVADCPKRETGRMVEWLHRVFPLDQQHKHLKRVKPAPKEKKSDVVTLLVATICHIGDDIDVHECNVDEEKFNQIISHLKNEMLKDKKGNSDILDSLQNWRQFDIPKHQPVTRERYQMMNSCWPMNYFTSGVTPKSQSESAHSFDEEQLLRIRKFLSIALEQADLARQNKRVPVGAVVVDPMAEDRIMAMGHDSLRLKDCLNNHLGCIDVSAETVDDHNQDETVVCSPYMHAAFVCIESVSEYRRQSRKRSLETDSNIKATQKGADYLCTNMDLFITHEPCITCCMAILHQRFKRVFYIHDNPLGCGAFKSHYGIHNRRNLNHRFEVFKCTL